MNSINTTLLLLTDAAMIFGGLLFIAIGKRAIKCSMDNFIETTAVIERIEKPKHSNSASEYKTYVSYTVNGKEYYGRVGVYSVSFRPGQEISIYYNPDNPEEIYGEASGLGLITLIVGVVLLVIPFISIMKLIIS